MQAIHPYRKPSTKSNTYELLRERDGLVCGICHLSLEAAWAEYEVWRAWKKSNHHGVRQPLKRGRIELTIDHIIPRSVMRKKGKTYLEWNSFDNLQLAHKRCNSAKGDKHDEAEG